MLRSSESVVHVSMNQGENSGDLVSKLPESLAGLSLAGGSTLLPGLIASGQHQQAFPADLIEQEPSGSSSFYGTVKASLQEQDKMPASQRGVQLQEETALPASTFMQQSPSLNNATSVSNRCCDSIGTTGPCGASSTICMSSIGIGSMPGAGVDLEGSPTLLSDKHFPIGSMAVNAPLAGPATGAGARPVSTTPCWCQPYCQTDGRMASTISSAPSTQAASFRTKAAEPKWPHTKLTSHHHEKFLETAFLPSNPASLCASATPFCPPGEQSNFFYVPELALHNSAAASNMGIVPSPQCAVHQLVVSNHSVSVPESSLVGAHNRIDSMDLAAPGSMPRGVHSNQTQGPPLPITSGANLSDQCVYNDRHAAHDNVSPNARTNFYGVSLPTSLTASPQHLCPSAGMPRVPSSSARSLPAQASGHGLLGCPNMAGHFCSNAPPPLPTLPYHGGPLLHGDVDPRGFNALINPSGPAPPGRPAVPPFPPMQNGMPMTLGYPTSDGAVALAMGSNNLSAAQMMNIQHTVMKLTLMAPNKQELRKIVQGVLSEDRISEAHVMVGMMRLVGLPVDVVMYNLLMTAYKKSRQWQHVIQVMQQMQASGVPADIVSYNILIDACGKAQQLPRAFEYFDEMSRIGLQPGVNTYTSLIDACGKAQHLGRAYQLLTQMQQKGVQPNAHTFTTIINACMQAQDLDLGLQVLEQMVKCGAAHEVGQSSTAPYTALIRACGKAFAVDRAFKVLRTMLDVGLKPNVVTFNCLIDACGQAKDLNRAFQVLRLMYHYNNKPDAVTYAALIDTCIKTQAIDKAFELVVQMQREKIAPTANTYNLMLDACIKVADVDRSMHVLQLMVTASLRPSTMPCLSEFVQMCGQAGQLSRAFEAVAFLKQHMNFRPSAAVYSALIDICIQAQDALRGMDILQEMLTYSEPTDADVFNSLIELCGDTGKLDAAMQIFGCMNHVQVVANSLTFKALLGACLSCSDMSRAKRVLHDTVAAGWEPDASLCEALLVACIRNGESVSGLLQQFGQDGLLPGHESFYPSFVDLLISTGCSASAVQVYFHLQSDSKLIVPDTVMHQISCTIGSLPRQAGPDDLERPPNEVAPHPQQ